METLKKHKHKLFWLLPIAILLIWISFNGDSAVKGEVILFVDPPQAVFKVGDEIEVAVKLKSEKDVNAIKAGVKIIEDENIIEVVDISKSDSFISLWISEPAFSEEEKLIDFVGGVPNPGFNGEGKIFSVKLKAKKPGEVIIDFPSAAVLANDGKGTDILEKKIGATYLIVDNGAPSPDLNNDGKVSMSDISILFSNWGKVTAKNARYDLNRDGKVGLLDLSILISKMSAQ
ncbi:MAG: dockerin type I domain-containing protein [bacterium]|nr:dockerin type I domain-containing protein [bacterium]